MDQPCRSSAWVARVGRLVCGCSCACWSAWQDEAGGVGRAGARTDEARVGVCKARVCQAASEHRLEERASNGVPSSTARWALLLSLLLSLSLPHSSPSPRPAPAPAKMSVSLNPSSVLGFNSASPCSSSLSCCTLTDALVLVRACSVYSEPAFHLSARRCPLQDHSPSLLNVPSRSRTTMRNPSHSKSRPPPPR